MKSPVFALFLLSSAAIAQEAPSLDLSWLSAVNDLIRLFSNWQTIGAQAGFAALLTILISTIKISALRPLWDKLGPAKIIAPSLLSLIAYLLTLQSFSFPVILAAITTGVGAVYLHELLNAIRMLPAVNKYVLMVVDVLQILLKRK
jgi:hypothetical protein